MKVVPFRVIKKSVSAINEYYDNHPSNYFIDKTYLYKNHIVKEKDLNAVISRLEGLGLIDIKNEDGYSKIVRSNRCKSYIEERREMRSDIYLSYLISITALIISAIALINDYSAT